VKAEALISLLQSEVSRLRKLKGEDVAFFFIMSPGDDNPLTELSLGTKQDSQSFYRGLADKLGQAQKAALPNDPYIGVGGRLR
jgi:hypothetical protein